MLAKLVKAFLPIKNFFYSCFGTPCFQYFSIMVNQIFVKIPIWVN